MFIYISELHYGTLTSALPASGGNETISSTKESFAKKKKKRLIIISTAHRKQKACLPNEENK